jgi:MFS transporter, OFA family, oxalate/formate antiporter
VYQVPQDGTRLQRSHRWVTHSPVYYGWIILIAGTIGMIMTSPGQTYAISLFIDPLMRELDISRSYISVLYAAGTLIGSLALPFFGRQIDRRGPRIMVVVIALLFGVACLYMAVVRNALMLAIGFVAIRMFGQGGLGLVSQNIINQWWVRNRGAMMGLSGLFMAMLGLAAFPNLIHSLLAAYGWRMTYVILGIMVLGTMLPVGYFFFRAQPELYGLQPDGKSGAGETTVRLAAGRVEEHWTPHEVFRTPVFWTSTLSLATLGMLSTGLFFHMVSIFEDNRLEPGIAAAVFVPIAVTTALINFGSGLLVDRMPVRVLLTTALVLQSVSLLMAQSLTSINLAIFYGVLLGASGGLQRTVSSVLTADYFGRRHLGAIAGVTTTIMIAGSALGPLPFAMARDAWGSYEPVLVASAIPPLVLGVISLFLGRPTRPALKVRSR